MFERHTAHHQEL